MSKRVLMTGAATVTIIGASIAMLAPNASACTTPVDQCREWCIETKTIDHASGVEEFQYSTVHKGAQDFGSIGLLKDKKGKKIVRDHCTAPDEFDAIYTGLGTPAFSGYTMGQNGSITSPKGKEVYRCQSARFDNVVDKTCSYEWTEYLTGFRSWDTYSEHMETVCFTCSVPMSPAAPVPEPTTTMLFGAGLLSMAFFGRIKK